MAAVGRFLWCHGISVGFQLTGATAQIAIDLSWPIGHMFRQERGAGVPHVHVAWVLVRLASQSSCLMYGRVLDL